MRIPERDVTCYLFTYLRSSMNVFPVYVHRDAYDFRSVPTKTTNAVGFYLLLSFWFLY